jgi:hypothetical protein
MAAVAYDREMSAALDTLFTAFQEWKRSGITPFALDEKIHQYHNGAARELYKSYVTGDADMAVLFALKKCILKIEELNEDCRAFSQERLDGMRE